MKLKMQFTTQQQLLNKDRFNIHNLCFLLGLILQVAAGITPDLQEYNIKFLKTNPKTYYKAVLTYYCL